MHVASTFTTTSPGPVHEALFDALRGAPAFAPSSGWELASAHHRPMDLAPWARLADLARPLARAELSTQRSLELNRLLWNGYEQGNLYLPRAASGDVQRAFEGFYDPALVSASAGLRPLLEGACFSFLEGELPRPDVTTVEELRALAARYLETYEGSKSEVVARIRAAAHPARAARLFLLQVAPDFLSEASQMARALPGNFGPMHSELTKIFIDEFGYGVHASKHSTLFERTLESCGLRSEAHAYYHWYLPTSLLMTSYFYAVTIDKRRFCEYLGALWWIEAVVPHFNRQLRTVLKELFGEATDTEYFDEHVGIDVHHRRMALEKLIVPAASELGPEVLHDVVRGIETARLLGELADADWFAQVDFLDGLAPVAPSEGPFVEAPPGPSGWLVAPRVADVATEVRVAGGAADVDGGYLAPVRIPEGHAFTVPAGRLYGVRAADDGPARVATRPAVGR